jgi:rSAM/selenodomain-associated transferase 1
MTRAPSAPGKSRLIPHVPGARLEALRAALLADTLLTAGTVRDVDLFLFFTPDEAAAEMAGLAGSAWTLVPQRGDDLGQRMGSAFDGLLAHRGYAAALLVGSDIPLLTTSHLTTACGALEAGADLVLGPADDGGYYLIGMRRADMRVFEGIAWSTASVLADTVRTADRLGLTRTHIDRAYDIDTIDDLRRLERELVSASAAVAPNLRRWLRG